MESAASYLLSEHDTRSHLKELSLDVYRLLLDFLTPSQAILLSLACQGLWRTFVLYGANIRYEARRCNSLSDTIEFLSLLERGVSSMLVCTACLKLHPRLANEIDMFEWSRFSMTIELPKCASAMGTISVGRIQNPFNVPREAIELILRGSRLGPSHGLGLHVLRRRLQWEAFGLCRVPVRFCTEALVFREAGADNLVFQTAYEVDIDLRRPLQDQIAASEVQTCLHKEFLQQQNLEQMLVSVSEGSKPVYSRVIRSFQCAYCPTDTVSHVIKKRAEYFATLIVCSWRDLGPSGDHLLAQWQHQTNDSLRRPFPRDAAASPYTSGRQHLAKVYGNAKRLLQQSHRATAEVVQQATAGISVIAVS